MLRFVLGCWLALCLPLGVVGQTLTLATSRPNPFVGEVITFTLELANLPAGGPPELIIPWWKTVTGWQESELSWINRHTTALPGSVPLRVGNFTIHAARARLGVHQLQWSLVVPESKEDQPITLGPITIGTARSNVLTLEPRRPPPLLASSAVWNLGLGRYEVSARWLPDTVALGEETTLEITVSGEGNRAAFAQPALGSYPGWEGTKLLTEGAGSVFGASSRVLHYRVRPRQMGLALPPLAVTWFDPVREVQVNERVTLPLLKVMGARGLVVKPGHTVEDARRHLPDYLVDQLNQHDHGQLPWYRSLQSLMTWLPWLPLVWVAFLMAQLALHRFASEWVEEQRRRRVLSRYRKALQDPPSSAEEERQRLMQFVNDFRGMDLLRRQEVDAAIAPLLTMLDRWQFGAPPQEVGQLFRQQASAYLQECGDALHRDANPFSPRLFKPGAGSRDGKTTMATEDAR